MFIEIPLLQKGSLYLGHPTYSMSVVLFTMLVFSGLGSYYSSSIALHNMPRFLFRCLYRTAIVIAAVGICLEYIIAETIGFILPFKILIFIIFTAIAAFLMGIALPSGMRLLHHAHPKGVPWAWALNAGASVMGSVLAIGVSMNLGYRYVWWCGVCAYLIACLCIRSVASVKHSCA